MKSSTATSQVDIRLVFTCEYYKVWGINSHCISDIPCYIPRVVVFSGMKSGILNVAWSKSCFYGCGRYTYSTAWVPWLYSTPRCI